MTEEDLDEQTKKEIDVSNLQRKTDVILFCVVLLFILVVLVWWLK